MKKIMCMVLAVILGVSVCLTGCGDAGKDETTDGRITVTVAHDGAEEAWKNDDYYKYVMSKGDVDFDFISLPVSGSGEKVRIWINSGDMPDMVYTAFTMDEYAKYVEQGLIKKMPDDFDEKYPNLGFGNTISGVYDKLKAAGDGSIYTVLRPEGNLKAHNDVFRKAYENGEDITELMRQKEYMNLGYAGFAYRKDWAEKLGIETDYIMDYDAFMDMAMKFKEADLGGVGKDKTVAIAADYTEAPNIFITAFNTSYKYFHKDDETGKYVCGLLDEETIEGVKEYTEAYRNGLLSKDFYTLKSGDLNSIFCSEAAGVIYPGVGHTLKGLYNDFKAANPELNPADCIDICWLRSPDGKVHVRNISNGGSFGWLFSPDISDEKLDRILSLMDYCSSPEGALQVQLGVPDVDFKNENGVYTILREKNEDGEYPSLGGLYPSYELFSHFGYVSTVIPGAEKPFYEKLTDILDAAIREEELSLLKWDPDREFFVSDELTKFNATYEVNNLFAEVVTADGDPEKLWNEKREKIAKDAEKIAADMNEQLLK